MSTSQMQNPVITQSLSTSYSFFATDYVITVLERLMYLISVDIMLML